MTIGKNIKRNIFYPKGKDSEMQKLNNKELLEMAKERLGGYYYMVQPEINNALGLVPGCSDRESHINADDFKIGDRAYTLWYSRQLTTDVSPGYSENIFRVWSKFVKENIGLKAFVSNLDPGRAYIFVTDLEKAKMLEQSFN